VTVDTCQRQANCAEVREFWKAVFVAHILRGEDVVEAELRANDAVDCFLLIYGDQLPSL
jgi:hypothetical protein